LDKAKFKTHLLCKHSKSCTAITRSKPSCE